MDTSKLKFKAEIMDENAMKRALRRIAHEIIENNGGVENLKLVGIQRRGVTLAKMIREIIEQVEGVRLPLGVLDITFYRDDLSSLSEHPVVNATDLPFQVQDARIVMVDDVLFSGRTARAAMDAICDMGRRAQHDGKASGAAQNPRLVRDLPGRSSGRRGSGRGASGEKRQGAVGELRRQKSADEQERAGGRACAGIRRRHERRFI